MEPASVSPSLRSLLPALWTTLCFLLATHHRRRNFIYYIILYCIILYYILLYYIILYYIHSFIHSVFCLTTGPKPPPKRCLHIERSRAIKWEYPLLSLRSSNSFLRLLPRLLATYIILYYITLRYIILYYVTLYYIIYYIKLRYVTLYYIILRYVILYYVTLRYIIWYYITLRYIILYYIILRYVTLYYISLYYSVFNTTGMSHLK